LLLCRSIYIYIYSNTKAMLLPMRGSTAHSISLCLLPRTSGGGFVDSNDASGYIKDTATNLKHFKAILSFMHLSRKIHTYSDQIPC